eukprot:38544_1
MGKRKSKKKVMKRVVAKVPTIFDCPFCNHSDTVECKMDKREMEGRVRCRVCGSDFRMMISHLHDPIDVYSEWIDECHKAANPDQYEDTDANVVGDQPDDTQAANSRGVSRSRSPPTGRSDRSPSLSPIRSPPRGLKRSASPSGISDSRPPERKRLKQKGRIDSDDEESFQALPDSPKRTDVPISHGGYDSDLSD